MSPSVVDGDTLRCRDQSIRLSVIDAPEMPGHCAPGRQCVAGDPFESKANLERLVSGQPVSCEQITTDRYGRAVAACTVFGADIECAQVKGGYAVVRYGSLSC
ncbi:thermonuclease family protein [Tolypothrix campylonemoides VB511288]|nr:thermonuclease family protein [Tolypothrix campylonemoides VB511288]